MLTRGHMLQGKERENLNMLLLKCCVHEETLLHLCLVCILNLWTCTSLVGGRSLANFSWEESGISLEESQKMLKKIGQKGSLFSRFFPPICQFPRNLGVWNFGAIQLGIYVEQLTEKKNWKAKRNLGGLHQINLKMSAWLFSSLAKFVWKCHL